MKKLILIISLLTTTIANAQSGNAIICGNLNLLNDNDTVSATVLKYGDFEVYKKFQTQTFAKVKNQCFRLQLPTTDRPLFFCFDLSFKKLEKNISNLVVETGDSIVMAEVNNSYVFTGKGSEKYNLIIHLQEITNKWMSKSDLFSLDSAKQYSQNVDNSILERLTLLDKYKSMISNQTYHLIYNSILTDKLFTGFVWSLEKLNFQTDFQKGIKGYVSNPLVDNNLFAFRKDTDLVRYSSGFYEAVKFDYKRDSCYLMGKTYSDQNYYNYVKKAYSGNTRDGLVTWFIYHSRHKSDSLIYFVNDALTYVKFPDFKDLLISLKNTGLKGSPAYPFLLTDINGKKRSYNEFNGKAILIDFWYTGCPACREMAPYLKNVEQSFKGKNVVFITVSVDKNKSQWKKSVAANTYSSEYSINLFTDGLGMKNPMIEYYNLSSFPTLILIDRNGRMGDVVSDPRLDKGKSLIGQIENQL